ncbi:hypothetical protein [Phycisphaera mikurensis]|uniref:DUF433 domain-containing protein n=1 Tax=Phycisphaera mikurensis (strain NBRC 102666 / KCTC 22515 / FYK2301M01) TaxID=1142394 RepID=I0IJ58_PHYMF|nr:hypothetical protein [Phycisphaera mikurensis]MBB6443268.1 uncharacterized protein (DUF433 family) [Phycisphaera mikurensis]BAM05296.1 hypothetical protein PSMK_31370 [Phycisphaera mikurensis NBRC 102666]
MAQVAGNGIYTLPEAAALIGMKVPTLRSWFRDDGRRRSLFRGDYLAARAGERLTALSFHDLVEAVVAVKLKGLGMTPQRIRRTHAALAEAYGTPHPFAYRGFFVSEKADRVFAEFREDDPGGPLRAGFLEVGAEQHAIREVLQPFLQRVDYDPRTELAALVRLTADGSVHLDPERGFGKPLVASCSQRTAVLHAAWLANGRDAPVVADWYGVTTPEVEAAVSFHEDFRGLAA